MKPRTRKAVIFAALAMSVAPTLTAQASSLVKAIIVHRVEGCDYFMVQMHTGYGILEWFGGHDPDKDDILYGDMCTYGMKNIHDETSDSSIRVWVEEYNLTKSDAMDKLLDACE
ncbi:hypothetical protein [Tunturiibacter gelidiferens]|uniref:hypothetical protein n=1 Tax=Tunturiibacter gelidiferens TaxID=3069689 RepID=UPI003D9BB7DE